MVPKPYEVSPMPFLIDLLTSNNFSMTFFAQLIFYELLVVKVQVE